MSSTTAGAIVNNDYPQFDEDQVSEHPVPKGTLAEGSEDLQFPERGVQ